MLYVVSDMRMYHTPMAHECEYEYACDVSAPVLMLIDMDIYVDVYMDVHMDV